MKGSENCAISMIEHTCNAEGAADANRDLPCFPVSLDDASRSVTEKGAERTDLKSGRQSTSEPRVAPELKRQTTASAPSMAMAAAAGDVETALARALARAADAGRFDIVVLLAREMEARRIARA
jgi:hypothetical protein